MYLRLAFSVAAHLEPDVLLVDEVLAVGDLKFQQKCLGKMDDIAHRGRTVLFVSHNLAAVKELCTRALVLNQGQLVFDGGAVEGVAHYSGCLVDSDASHGGVGWSGVRVSTRKDETVDNREALTVTADLTLDRDLEQGRMFLLDRRLHCSVPGPQYDLDRRARERCSRGRQAPNPSPTFHRCGWCRISTPHTSNCWLKTANLETSESSPNEFC